MLPRPWVKTGDIDINNQGFTNEQYEEKERLEKKPKKERTPEEQAKLDELKAMNNQRRNAISILRGISIRMPLLIYGAELTNEDEEITIDNFASLIDDQSWEEFMPKGVDKKKFEKFKRYYEPDVFREAGKRIREMARAADKFTIEERIERIATIFNTFRNPDKETVLTPWRVVNMHMSDCLGGWCFYDESFKQMLATPRYVDQGKVTADVFRTDSHILEINSKSGLYPLYIAYNIYRCRVEEAKKKYGEVGIGFSKSLWDATIEENILVVCKTPMAKSITKRTLAGFRDTKVNAQYYPNLIENISERPEAVVNTFRDGKHFWHINENQNMKLDAIVGNPPYQVMQTTEKTTSTQAALAGAVYPQFMDVSCKLKPQYTSLITPSRWMTKAGRGISDEWVDKMIHSNHFVKIHDFPITTDVFSNVEIKGGVNYYLYSDSYTGKCKYVFHKADKTYIRDENLDSLGIGIVIRDLEASNIIKKVIATEGDYIGEKSFASLVASGTLFCDCAKGILNTSWKGYVLDKDEEHNIKYYLNKGMVTRGYAWIKKGDMIKAFETVDIHKVYIPKAGGSGNDPVVLGIPFYGEPGSICSQTYICIGYDPIKHNFSKEECMNIISYIKTRFFRFMVSVKKKTQDAFAQVYEFVPLQDFTKPWTDEELYKKYNLTDDEIKFIESMIKPME